MIECLNISMKDYKNRELIKDFESCCELCKFVYKVNNKDSITNKRIPLKGLNVSKDVFDVEERVYFITISFIRNNQPMMITFRGRIEKSSIGLMKNGYEKIQNDSILLSDYQLCCIDNANFQLIE